MGGRRLKNGDSDRRSIRKRVNNLAWLEPTSCEAIKKDKKIGRVTSCTRDLLLCNKLLQNSVAEPVINLCYLSWCPWVRSPGAAWLGGSGSDSLPRLWSEVSWDCSHLKAQRGLGGLLRSGSFTRLVSSYLSSDVLGGLPQRESLR